MTYPSPTQIPVTLIAGYLGAGKTTLVNKLLNSKKLPANTAVLVNDFGDINIDEQLIKNDSQVDNVIGLANGCICCSIADDLTAALEQVRASGVERVILECSGVAEPAKARQQCYYPGFYPQACIVLVDAQAHDQRCDDKYVGVLARAQVQQADLLVVTKTALNSQFQLVALQPSVAVEDAGCLDLVLGWQAQDFAPDVHGDEQQPHFAAKTWRITETVSSDAVRAYLLGQPQSLQRVKGYLQTHEGIVEVQQVGRQIEIHARPQLIKGSQELGLVFIGYRGEELPQQAPLF